MQVTVNQKTFKIEVPPETSLLWVLREECGLTGTKFGCGKGLCGACTIHLNGAAIRSCITPVSVADGASLTTIEGLASAKGLHPCQTAWLEEDVVQCGYCQSGQIMSAAALLLQNPKPDEAALEAAMSGNICRCGTYPRIRAAIHKASLLMQKGNADEPR
ncbi:MAG: (2Fe-2S)-binding protein [Proteobacteria bacterium]|nr:(2Fe-2S)-binding protein [Pseudomonadota bacterium]